MENYLPQQDCLAGLRGMGLFYPSRNRLYGRLPGPDPTHWPLAMSYFVHFVKERLVSKHQPASLQFTKFCRSLKSFAVLRGKMNIFQIFSKTLPTYIQTSWSLYHTTQYRVTCNNNNDDKINGDSGEIILNVIFRTSADRCGKNALSSLLPQGSRRHKKMTYATRLFLGKKHVTLGHFTA